jgi:hypothetical protein
VPWGWLEWAVLAQTLFPAMLFVPGMTKVRVLTRVGAFSIALLAMAATFLAGHSRPGMRSFPAFPWIAGCAIWYVAAVLHPTTNSLLSGLACMGLNLAVMSPVFWAASSVRSPRQIERLMTMLLLCNAASSLVGIGQVFRPERFNPPEVADYGKINKEDLKVVNEDGTEIYRPPGLSDTPAMAAKSGLIAGVVGIGWALMPIAWWKRLISLGLGFAGVIVIYFSQTRLMLMVQTLGLIAMFVVLLLRRDFRKAAVMGAAGTLIFFGAIAYVTRVGGEGVLKRFQEISDNGVVTATQNNRGMFIEYALTYLLPEYPVGAGLGRWGMTYEYFGDHNAGPERRQLWPEIQIGGWVCDGGAPLLFAYGTAIVLALLDSVRIALRSKDERLASWATVVVGLDLAIAVCAFGDPTFVTPLGVLFWVLGASLHAADCRSRAELARQ